MDNNNDLALMKFGVGQPVSRNEDPMLLKGQGRYTDDVNIAGQAYCVPVRSPYAHGIIRSIDTSAARAMPGVLAVYVWADLEKGGIGKSNPPMAVKNRDGSNMRAAPRPALANGKVRYVGEAYAAVIAETVAQGKDAAEAVVLEIEPLPAITTIAEALAPGAPNIHDEAPGNVTLDYHFGNTEAVNEAFAKAAHVTKLRPVSQRIVVNPMEPRSCVAEFRDGKYIVTVCSQGVFGLKQSIANDILKVPPAQVQVITGNVGGSFGMKVAAYPEYICTIFAAKQLGRPVKWTDERSGSFVSDHHGRDHEVTGEVAFDKDGLILAVRLTGYGNYGAFQGLPLQVTVNAVKNIVGVYRTPLVEVNTKCVLTNSTPVGAYRGAGRPEGNYYMERLMTQAAREMKIDPLELRRRNHIQPSALPYKAPSDLTYDSGDFPSLFRDGLAAADWTGYGARKAASDKKGKLRGRGIGHYLEVTAPPGKEMGGIRFEPNGDVTIVTGTLDYGQGHHAPFAQVLVQRLGIPFERVRLVQGDSDQLIAGGGTGGSRSIMASGTAIVLASDKVIDNGKLLAGHFLEAAAADIEFGAGRFTIAGTDRSIGLLEIADRLKRKPNLPDGVPTSLDVSMVVDSPPSAFPNGCHVCEVEIDPETGVVAVDKYTMVDDFGVIVNPMLVEGQVHGGVVQGIGQALFEETRYSKEGQLLTGSFMDYAMPRASDVPSFKFASHPVPAKSNLLGVKGCGEAGCSGSLPAVMNAVIDALSVYGIEHIDMPATPHKVWQAIRNARQAAE
ncbi:MAG TPA: xanthine dehydrogenase family protein molybdopterin-binding subunit [Stellaceae bacterium]|nr:xanthine dehydrogenase family protein molybdopterin-binding subunit [Stellaceae bacterium]